MDDKKNKRFAWPIWPLPLIIFLSGFSYPMILDNRFADVETSLCLIGWALVILRYLWGWKRGGYLLDLLAYCLIAFMMPFIASIFVGVLIKFVE